jgi:hypothetical protein
VSFVAISLCVASVGVFIVIVVYFVIDSSPETFGYTLVCDRNNWKNIRFLQINIRMFN